MKWWIAAILFVAAVLFLTVNTGSSYGVSVGTDTHYCSLDWVHGGLHANCEAAG